MTTAQGRGDGFVTTGNLTVSANPLNRRSALILAEA